jgi:hypothetical protein
LLVWLHVVRRPNVLHRILHRLLSEREIVLGDLQVMLLRDLR